MKIAMAITLMFQMGLVGLSAAMISRQDATPAIVGIHATLIAINLLFGAINVLGIIR